MEKMDKFNTALMADGLTAYAAERQTAERCLPPDSPSWTRTRRLWTNSILRGMARLQGDVPDPKLMERLDQQLKEARDFPAVGLLTPERQKELVSALSSYVLALEADGGDHRPQVIAARDLLDDMAACLSWDSCANGADKAVSEAKDALLRMTARMPVRFTLIQLGAAPGPGNEELVSGVVHDADGVWSTRLFDGLSHGCPERQEQPAVCTVYLGGGLKTVDDASDASDLDLKLMREAGPDFLQRPEITPVCSYELCVPAQEQAQDGPSTFEMAPTM